MNFIEHFKTHPQWPEVVKVLSTLTGAGYQAFLVGGAVRDAALGISVKDFDVATDARPEVVESLFQKTVSVGKDFGVINVVVSKDVSVEVTTFRSESEYNQKRQPTKITFTDLEGDASRRDFTMNALYFDVFNDKLIDPFGGLNDLNERVLKGIGDPLERLLEDPLRILRAIRFVSRFKMALDPELSKAIENSKIRLHKISKERIFDELSKSLVQTSWRQSLSLLCEFKIFPELSMHDISRQRAEKILKISVDGDFSQVCGWMWSDLTIDEVKSNLNSMAASNAFKAEVIFYIFKGKDLFSVRKREGFIIETLFSAPKGFLVFLAGFSELENLDQEFKHIKSLSEKFKTLPEPLATGERLQREGIKKGPQLGALKRELFYQQLEGKFTSLDQLKDKITELRRTSNEV